MGMFWQSSSNYRRVDRQTRSSIRAHTQNHNTRPPNSTTKTKLQSLLLVAFGILVYCYSQLDISNDNHTTLVLESLSFDDSNNNNAIPGMHPATTVVVVSKQENPHPHNEGNDNNNNQKQENQLRTTLSAANTVKGFLTLEEIPDEFLQKKKLRFDWTNLTPSIDFTRQMVTHQSNCSVPMGTFLYRNRFGLGSDLHVWGQALCNGMAMNMRIRTVGNWTWMDQQHCHNKISPMLCYFQQSELNCPGDHEIAIAHPNFDPQLNLSRSNGIVKDFCSNTVAKDMDKRRLRTAGLEYLFTRVTPLLQKEAERQLSLVFQKESQVPKDLITVHIRWGDKAREMKLVSIQEYIEAVNQILDKRPGASRDKANIYLATEDPEAVKQFQEAMPSTGWKLFLDQAYVEMLPYRVVEYNGSPKMSKAVGGRAGLVVLGSLLVAMEANDFVLTTSSNWSRLVNELRKSIVEPRCNNCTSIVDLRKVKFEW